MRSSSFCVLVRIVVPVDVGIRPAEKPNAFSRMSA